MRTALVAALACLTAAVAVLETGPKVDVHVTTDAARIVVADAPPWECTQGQ
ncbi:hypothetical protein GCM10011576_41600 [Micromonospora parathelypteridis]|uniref:Uncharacterized protein n=1 Tax=Micromonospora parathelypteridis TaxID=1839617 RepID=A0A840W6F5_9ACTN|nr:hypothetical protein [Micromonospora parathelypteridis]GGO22366.1 hypothetical protein GCM10011576_41600 [Micromonospora parathelypteridis]